jgi:adhesin transport system outer membrane protein
MKHWAKALVTAGAMSALSGCAAMAPSDPVQDAVQLAVASEHWREQSPAIATLAEKPSMFPRGGAYDTVARAATTADLRASDAKLKGAMLRAEAAAKNWLPSFQPGLRLDDLGTLAASLVIEQVVFDNGRRKAEREAAKADVELAAVEVSQEANERAFEALSLLAEINHAQDKISAADAAATRLKRMQDIASARISGGVADPSERQVLALKAKEVQVAITKEQARARNATRNLSAMIETTPPVPEVDSGQVNAPITAPLSLLTAQADAHRAEAVAKAARASLFPGVTMQGLVTDGGSEVALAANSAPLGFGTPALLKAADADVEAAKRSLQKAQKDNAREIDLQRAQIDDLDREYNAAKALMRQARRNQSLFEQQFQYGRKSLMDVVSAHENAARIEARLADLAYERRMARLTLGRDLGVLVGGAEL